jgi:hypothetical protein
MKQRAIDIKFPLAGLNRRSAYRQQPEYTTPDALNVRATATIEGRERGGSRPGLVKSHIENLGGSVRLLDTMTVNLGDGFTSYSDVFDGTEMSSSWSLPVWATAMPSILSLASSAQVDTTIEHGSAVLDKLNIDTTKAYIVEALLIPWGGSFAGTYTLYLRLDDTSPNIATAGVAIALTISGSTGAYTGTVTSVIGGVSTVSTMTAGTLVSIDESWLSAEISGDSIVVYFGDAIIYSGSLGAQTGTRVGIGLDCNLAGGVCLMNVFRVQYYETIITQPLRTFVVASADGDLFYEQSARHMTQVSSSLTLRDDVWLSSAQDGQKLYIADWGNLCASGTDGSVSGTSLTAISISDWTALSILPFDMVAVISNVEGTAIAGTYRISTVSSGSVTLSENAGTGACAYRIERAPKVYDPLTNTLSIMTATVGQVPTGCPLVCRYLGKIVLAGAEIAPHVWYMSRNNNPLDWDYNPETADAEEAIAGTASPAGVPGEPIVALIPHGDDYLDIVCRNSYWRMRGDPGDGGKLDAISRGIGIVGPNAWCLTPDNNVIFLSADGLYLSTPYSSASGEVPPASMSRDSLPKEFLNLNPNTLTISLEYDIQGRGVHIFFTSVNANARYHWWFDYGRKTYWPISLESDHEPTATCTVGSTVVEDNGVVLGGRDGYLRRFNDYAATDCGVEFNSYVLCGPIALAPDMMEGSIVSVDAVIASGSGSVTWAVYPSMTFEGAVTAVQADTGLWHEGLNFTVYPSGRGQAFVLKLTGELGRRWAIEQVQAVIREGGLRRIV